jgi:hypothetical protein
MIEKRRLHGFRIVGFVFTEWQQVLGVNRECGIVLVDRETLHERFVTGWYRDGDAEWSNGHYFNDRVAATWDMTSRAVGTPPEKRPAAYGGTP